MTQTPKARHAFALWLFLFAALVAASAHAAEKEKGKDKDDKAKELRVLTDWSIVDDSTLLRIKISLNGNDMQPLGRIAYSGRQLRMTIDDTLLDPDAPRKLAEEHPAIDKVEVRSRRHDVEFYVTLKERDLANPEHIVFVPGRDQTVVEIRKPAYYAAASREVPRAIALPQAAPAPAPSAQAVPMPQAAAAPQADPAKLRAETLNAVFGEGERKTAPKATDEEKAQPLAAAASAAPPAATPPKPAAQPALILGQEAPDFSSLYLMAGLVVVAGVVWFVFSRMRGLSIAQRLDDASLRILKQQSIGGRQRLILVEAENKRLLLAANDRDLRLIAELDNRTNPDQAFGQALSQTRGSLFEPPAKPEPFYAARATNPPGHPQPQRNPTERPSFFGADGEEESAPEVQMSPAAGPEEETSLRDRLRALRQRR